MNEAAQTQPNFAARFQRITSAPGSGHTSIVIAIFAGAILIPAPKAVRLFGKVLLPEFAPMQLIGMFIIVLGMASLLILKFVDPTLRARRLLYGAAMSMFISGMLSPILCLLDYGLGTTGPTARYYAVHGVVGTDVVLVDRQGHEAIQSAWVNAWSARAHECVDAAQVNGALGMQWVKIVAMTPPPARGGLWWDFPANDCFAATNLSDLVER